MEVKARLFAVLQQRKLTLPHESSQRSPPKLARWQTLLFFHDDIGTTKNADQDIQRI